MLVPVKAEALFCGEAKLTDNLEKVLGVTVKLKRSVPVLEIVPELTEINAVSALYKVTFKVATPFTKVTEVFEPKAMLPANGEIAGFKETLAPENTMDLVPV